MKVPCEGCKGRNAELQASPATGNASAFKAWNYIAFYLQQVLYINT